jgi:hypothetical protein
MIFAGMLGENAQPPANAESVKHQKTALIRFMIRGKMRTGFLGGNGAS